MSISTVVFSPVDPRRVWAGGSRGFLWDSDDAGATWSAVGKPPGTNIRMILPDPRNLDRLIVATDGGLFESGNAGSKWAALRSLSAPGKTISARDPRNPDTLFFTAPTTGLLRSDDGGRRWRKLADLPSAPVSLTLEKRAPGIFLATEATLLRSDNSGERFVPLPKPVASVVADPLRERRWYGLLQNRPQMDDGVGFNRFDCSLPPSPDGDGGVLVAGTDFLAFADRKGVFYRTFCGVDDWTPIERRSLVGPDGAVACLSVDPKNWKRWLAADGKGIWLAEDVGRSWKLAADAV